MTEPFKLFLHEEIMLLALRDAEGTTAAGSMYQYAIAGAIIAELLLRKRLAVEDSKKKLVNVTDPTPVGEPLLDESLNRIHDAKRRASLQSWVSRLANTKDLKHRVAGRLCRRGILKMSEDKVLLIFTRKIYPEIDPGPEEELIARMREAIFTDRPDIDPRTVILVSLAESAGLLESTFDKKELENRETRIEQLTNGEMTGQATQEAVEAMQAAAATTAAMTAATVAATTAATSASC